MPWQHWALDEQPLTFFKKNNDTHLTNFRACAQWKWLKICIIFWYTFFVFPFELINTFWFWSIQGGHFHQATNPEIVKRVSTHTLILSGSKPGGGHFSRYEAKSPWMCSKMRCRDISRSRRCPWVISSNLNEGRKNKNKILLISVVFLHCTTK